MHVFVALTLLALWSYCTAGPVPTDDKTFELNSYATPPVDIINMEFNNTAAGVVGICNIGQRYCAKQIINDLGFPIDRLIFNFCRNVFNSPGCQTCSTTGCTCDSNCIQSLFQRIDGKGWYTYQGTCQAPCIAGKCEGSIW
ncbi:hypothetical protein HBI78_004960 [Parastagonospora nodorum]|nr:hypothetical protein HBI78_004960 [Parastagonospora nodorum]